MKYLGVILGVGAVGVTAYLLWKRYSNSSAVQQDQALLVNALQPVVKGTTSTQITKTTVAPASTINPEIVTAPVSTPAKPVVITSPASTTAVVPVKTTLVSTVKSISPVLSSKLKLLTLNGFEIS